MQIQILADTREQHGANPHLDSLIIANNEKHPVKITHSVVQMTTGDYVILLDGKIRVIFERKTWADLAASIKDNRLASQSERMSELARHGCEIVYIIEGTLGKSVGHIDGDKLHSKMLSLHISAKVLQTPNPIGTAKTIVKLARMYAKYPITGGSADNILENPMEILTTIPPQKDSQISLDMWCTIAGVSATTASVLESMTPILNTIGTDPGNTYTGLKINNRKLPAATITNIKTALTTKIGQAKMLACINRITLEASTAILARYEISDLRTLSMKFALADVPVGTRKLGASKADNLLRLMGNPYSKNTR